MIKRRQKGFTIVELLVVIVVIGILASIAIVSYNGIQARAENTKTVAAVEAYATAAAIYKSDNDVYPVTGANSYACLGNASISDGCGSSGATTCSYSGAIAGTGYPAGMTQATIDKFKTVMTSLPEASKQRIDCGSSVTGNGIVYYSTNGAQGVFIYFLKNSATCQSPSGTVVYAPYSITSGSVRGCWLTLGP